MDGRRRKVDAYRTGPGGRPEEDAPGGKRPPPGKDSRRGSEAAPKADSRRDGKAAPRGPTPRSSSPRGPTPPAAPTEGFPVQGSPAAGTPQAATAPRKGRRDGDFPGTAGPGLLKITGRETSLRKAAKFLVLIGQEEAAKVLRHLSEEEVEAMTREIAGIRGIQAAEAEKLLEEFGFLKESLRYPSGGVEAARRILVGAFGEERGREILRRSLPAEQEKFFGYLEDFGPRQLYHLLRGESPAALAVIFPYLEPGTASALLTQFDPPLRRELVTRMARKGKVRRDILERMDEALREKTRRLASPGAEEPEVDGTGILAEILKYVDLSREEKILRDLGEDNPDVAEEIRERLFTMDVLDYMQDEDLRKLLQGMDDREIALLLKGKSDTVRARVLSSISERRRGFVAEEYRILGPVPRKEVDRATKDFLALLRRLEEEGKIVFRRERDIWVE